MPFWIGLGVLAVVSTAFGVWFRGRDARAWDALAFELQLERKSHGRYPDLVGSRDEVPLLLKQMVLTRGTDRRLVTRVVAAALLPLPPKLTLTLSSTRHVRVLGVKLTGRIGTDLSSRYNVSCKDENLANAMLLGPLVKPTLDALSERAQTAAAITSGTVQITRPWLQKKRVPMDIEQAAKLAKNLGLAWKAPFVELAARYGLQLESHGAAWVVRGPVNGRAVKLTTSVAAGKVCVETQVEAADLPQTLRVATRTSGKGGIVIDTAFVDPAIRIEGVGTGEAQMIFARSRVAGPLEAVFGRFSRSEIRERRVIVRTRSWPAGGLDHLVQIGVALAEVLEEVGDDPLLQSLPDLEDL